MADWKPGDVVAVRARVSAAFANGVAVLAEEQDGSEVAFVAARVASWPDAERLASLQAERDRLAEQVECPHLSRSGGYKDGWWVCDSCGHRSYDAGSRYISELEAQLALRDAVVEAARRWSTAWDATHGRTFYGGDEDGRRLIERRDAAENDLRAALDASENPRGATPKETT